MAVLLTVEARPRVLRRLAEPLRPEPARDELPATPWARLRCAPSHPARTGQDREVRRLIAALEIAIDPIEEGVAVAAARLQAKHGSSLRMPDALVLAYANACKAKEVLTADARWAHWSSRVEILGS